MKNSLKILLAFAVGVMLGQSGWLTSFPADADPAKYALYLLMFLVGISIGADPRSWSLLKRQGRWLFFVPLATIAGTFAGTLLVTVFIGDVNLWEGLAVGAGFGYYSLSSIIITQMHSESLGVIALLSNVIREIITLIMAPLMVMWFGKLSPIMSAGATSMDTTLPVITTTSGREYAIIALFHGIVLTILVPLMVTFILNLNSYFG